MDLFIVRHAIAEERRPGLPDADRELTAKGRRRFRRCVRGLAELELQPERVLTSPWRRARQTAELLAPLAERDPEIEEGLARAPDEVLLDALGATGAARLAVVGHEPWLGELAAWLVTGVGGEGRFVVKKGGLVHLRGAPSPGAMELRSLLPPKVLVALARA